MENTVTMPEPPITRLRPLHSHQQAPNQDLETRPFEVHDIHENAPEVARCFGSLTTRIDKHTCITAFLKLVSRIVALEPREAYCVQDSTRGGFILARSRCTVEEDGREDEEDGSFDFVACADDFEIPTDFSIGDGKVS